MTCTLTTDFELFCTILNTKLDKYKYFSINFLTFDARRQEDILRQQIRTSSMRRIVVVSNTKVFFLEMQIVAFLKNVSSAGHTVVVAVEDRQCKNTRRKNADGVVLSY